MTSFFKVPFPKNEPVKDYAKGSPERKRLIDHYHKLYKESRDIPMYIGDGEVRSGSRHQITPPHDHKRVIGTYHTGDASCVEDAIQSCLNAHEAWSSLGWEHRAAIFLKVAELVSGPYRDEINAATMLCQSKNVHQAEIEAACEFADFMRFNAHYLMQIYGEQPPHSPSPIWNACEYRALEGFVYAITPFNFTAIAANLPAAPALMGNVVLWKPSPSQIYSAQVVMKIFKEAGLPDGVINLVYTDAALTTKIALAHPKLSGIHFTGSTEIFKSVWKQVAGNIDTYQNYPRIVGETGGKDFIWAHPSADSEEVLHNIIRGAFEYQGQKCSAASRVYLPQSLWNRIKDSLKKEVEQIKVGAPDDTSCFVNAVIHERSFDRISGYIDRVAQSDTAHIFAGGQCDKSKGYFISPTVIETTDPNYETMKDELFGPVVTIWAYPDDQWSEVLDKVNNCSYALTGAIFSKDRYVIDIAKKKLTYAAGNFYINDKPTGAVVGQQPFGGMRASGTNDKAGSPMNLLRWVSVRTVKENLLPLKNYRYPFLES